MNEKDITLLRLVCQVQVQSAAIHGIVAVLSQMPHAQQLPQLLQENLRKNTDNMTFPGLPPAMSDMMAGEVQEAVESFLSALPAYSPRN